MVLHHTMQNTSFISPAGALSDYQKVYFLIIACSPQQMACELLKSRNTISKRSAFCFRIFIFLLQASHILLFAFMALKTIAYRNILLYNRDRKDGYQKVHFLIAVFLYRYKLAAYINRTSSHHRPPNGSDGFNHNAAACNP